MNLQLNYLKKIKLAKPYLNLLAYNNYYVKKSLLLLRGNKGRKLIFLHE